MLHAQLFRTFARFSDLFPARLVKVCLVVIAFAMAGCGGGGGSSSVTPPPPTPPAPSNQITITSLSTTQAAPFSSLTVTGSGFDPSAQVVVRFTRGDSSSFDIPPSSVTTTQVQIFVPPLISADGATVGPGTVAIQIVQTSGSTTSSSNTISNFAIQDLPVSTLTTGTVLMQFLDAFQLLNKDIEAQLAFTELASAGQVSTGQLRSSLETVSSDLSGLEVQLQAVISGNTNSVDLGTYNNGVEVVLNQQGITLMERLMLAQLAQLGATGPLALLGHSYKPYAGTSQTGCLYTGACTNQLYITAARASSTSDMTFTQQLVQFQEIVSHVMGPLALIPGPGGAAAETMNTIAAVTTLAVILVPAVENLAIDKLMVVVPSGMSQVAQEEQAQDWNYLKQQGPTLGKIAIDLLTLGLHSPAKWQKFAIGLLPDVVDFFGDSSKPLNVNTQFNPIELKISALNIQPPPVIATGTVSDNTGQAVAGALISCSNATLGTSPFAVTLSNGTFSGGLPSNSGVSPVNCVVTKPGYALQNLQMNTSSPNNVILTTSSITVTPAQLTFVAVLGGANPTAKELAISSSGSSSVGWSASVDSPWLAVSQSAGVTFAQLGVSVNSSGLAPGIYSGNVTLLSQLGDRVSVPVTLFVEPGLTFNPSSLPTFMATVGGTNPLGQTVTVSAPNSGTNWTADTNSPWLTLSPTSGTTPSAATVSVNIAGLAAGTYTGSIMAIAPNNLLSPAILQVTLIVLAPGVVTVSVVGPGQVTSMPAGINCPGTCTFTFDPNSFPFLIAAPSATFLGWTGGPCDSIPVSSCPLTPADLAQGVFTTASFGP